MQTKEELITFTKKLVADAIVLKDKYVDLPNIPVNYACVFSHNETEYQKLNDLAHQLGSIVEKTSMGHIFRVKPFSTEGGELQLVKIRKPDPEKPQRGYADFTVPNYQAFKKKYLSLPNFKLTEREDYEMIGLSDPAFDVRVYFAYPPIDQKLGFVSN